MGKKLVQIISIDCGKSNLKACSPTKEIIYPNQYSKGNMDEGLLGSDTYNITYGDINMVMGRNGTHLMGIEGKSDDLHMLSALTAVTHFIKPNKDYEIYMTYGESVNKYYNPENQRKIRNNLEGKHEIIVNGKQFNFDIKEVKILPEGIGHILADIDKYQDVQYIGDMGGSTFNFITCINGVPSEEESTSVPMGLNQLISKIRTSINRANLGNYKPLAIKQYVTKGTKNKKLKDIIDKEVDGYFDYIKNEIAMDTQLDLNDIVATHGMSFVGGVSELFMDELTKRYREATIIEDGVMATVRGHLVYAMHLFGKKLEANPKEELVLGGK